MSRILVDEEFVAVQPSLIRALDGKVVDALVLQYLHFWLRVSTNEYNDEIWVYNTYQDWSDRLGISADQARRAIERLEARGVVLSCQPRAGTYDHKKWYRVDYEHSCLIDLADLPDQSGDSARSSFYTERTNRENVLPSGEDESTTSSPASLKVVDDNPEEDDTMSARNDLPPASAAVSHPAATTRHLSVVPGEGDTAKKAKKPGIDDNPSEEVVALCTLLADLYHELGNTRPNPNQKGWYRACRLLLTKDGPDKKGWTPKQVETIMRWALADPFWQNNIQSMPTLREKFDRLRGRRNETITKGQTKPVGSRAQTDHDRIQAYRQELKDKVTT